MFRLDNSIESHTVGNLETKCHDMKWWMNVRSLGVHWSTSLATGCSVLTVAYGCLGVFVCIDDTLSDNRLDNLTSFRTSHFATFIAVERHLGLFPKLIVVSLLFNTMVATCFTAIISPFIWHLARNISISCQCLIGYGLQPTSTYFLKVWKGAWRESYRNF